MSERYQVFSGLEKSFIKILSKTDLFYRFEYMDWCGRVYLHVQGNVTKDIDAKIRKLSY